MLEELIVYNHNMEVIGIAKIRDGFVVGCEGVCEVLPLGESKELAHEQMSELPEAFSVNEAPWGTHNNSEASAVADIAQGYEYQGSNLPHEDPWAKAKDSRVDPTYKE